MDIYRTALAFARQLEAERAHRLGVWALRLGLGPRNSPEVAPALAQKLWGLHFANPVGLAAGFDKNAEVPLPVLRAGFGFTEVGSVTPRPQAGNPQPRLFRLPADEAVINRMGFNNDGLAEVRQRLERLPPHAGPIGANLGANKENADRPDDYVAMMRGLRSLADYFVVNISSPNTPGLRELQGKAYLRDLLDQVLDARGDVTAPVLVKIAPDLTPADIEDIADCCLASGIDGAIVSNTTVGLRDTLRGEHARETGGLSGRPLFALSTDILGQVYRATEGKLPLVGVGGIASGADAYGKIRRGASLVQLYTALIYEGPGLVRRINEELAALLARDGFENIQDAVGVDVD